VRNLERIWRRISRSDIFPISWRSLWGFARGAEALTSFNGLRRVCETNLPYRDLSEAALPVHVVATNVLSGEPVVLSRGSAIDAIVASSSIPAAFAPVKVDGAYLADGAITSNTPIQAAVALGARRLVVLSTGAPGMLEAPPRGALAAALHALTLLMARQMQFELQTLDRRVECHVIPAPRNVCVSPYDFSRTPELIDRGEECASRWLASGGCHARAEARRGQARAPLLPGLIAAGC
jgi:NTE family protein